jgi:hypothetical protein
VVLDQARPRKHASARSRLRRTGHQAATGERGDRLHTDTVKMLRNDAHFAALDGLRGVAASVVLFGHAALLIKGGAAVLREDKGVQEGLSDS